MLASIVTHLSDYPLLGKWFTAHHFLMILVGALMVLGFKYVALAVAARPKRTGVVSLVEVSLVWLRDEVVYLEMQGGCQGCGMAAVTLAQGIRRILMEAMPEIRDIVDVTNHDAGVNPYY